MSTKYKIGDLVWAKMRSYPWWPAAVASPRDDAKRPISKKHLNFVEFYGKSRTYQWIPDEFLHDYEEYKSEHSDCPSVSFQYALAQLKKAQKESQERKLHKSMGISPKKRSIAKKKPLKINHSPVTSVKTTPTKSVKTAFKSKKLLSSPVHTTKKSTKRRHSESSSVSSSSKVQVVDRDSSPVSDIHLSPDTMSSPEYYNDSVKKASRALYKRPVFIEKVPVQPLRLGDNLRLTNGSHRSDLKIGFICLDSMGANILKSLMFAGYSSITIYTTSLMHTQQFEDIGIPVTRHIYEVVSASDIIFSCASDPAAAKKVVFGHNGVLKTICGGKGYVEITTIDSDTSKDIADAITRKDGLYLEAPVICSKNHAMEGRLIILAAGDNKLFDKCKPCFQVMGEHAFFLGEVGNAANMNLIISMMLGTSLSCLAEAMSLAKRSGISETNLLDIIEICPLSCPFFTKKGRLIVTKAFKAPDISVNHMQKDMQLALQLGNKYVQALPTAAAANEMFKLAKSLGRGPCDAASLYTVQ